MIKSPSGRKRSDENSFEEWSSLYSEISVSEGQKESLSLLAIQEFTKLHIVQNSTTKIRDSLCSFIRNVSIRYNDVPYHSFGHAVHVLRNCYFLWSAVSSDELTQYEGLALLFSALIHDLDHQGVPNSTLISERHPYARLYNDKNVAEMRSLTLAFELLESEENNFLHELSDYELKRFREISIAMVLATDPLDHDAAHIFELKINDTLASDGRPNFKNDRERLLALSVILQLADIGASLQSTETSLIWSEKYFREVSYGSLEKQRSLDPQKFLEAQELYFNSSVRRLLSLERKLHIFPIELVSLLEYNLEKNIAQVREGEMKSAVYSWSNSHINTHPVYQNFTG